MGRYGNRATANGGIDSEGFGGLSVTASTISVNHVGASGGGIYDDVGATVSLTTSPVLRNQPDNCEPLGSILGCG